MLFLTVFAYGRMFEWYALIAINFCGIYIYIVKGPFSVLRQFLATKNLLKMIKNVFYFMLKAL